jgi:Arc/MetJ-type ribon-helix-helix transcriptional regulator
MTKRRAKLLVGKTAARATRVKIAVSLPRQHVAAAERAVTEGHVPSVSAYVARALERQAHADSLADLVAVMRVEDGAPSAEDYAWADAALGVIARPRRRKSPSK